MARVNPIYNVSIVKIAIILLASLCFVGCAAPLKSTIAGSTAEPPTPLPVPTPAPILVKAPVPSAQVPAVFMGDSITYFWQSYADFTKLQWIDKGNSGEKCADMEARFQSDVIDLKPASVQILCGTNDVIHEPTDPIATEAAITSMVEQARAAKITVVLGTIPPLRPEENGFLSYDMLAQIQSLNVWIRAYAASNGIPVAEYYSLLVGPDGRCQSQFMVDGIHPDAGGFAAMTTLAQSVFFPPQAP